MAGKFTSDAHTANSPKAAFYEDWARLFVDYDVEKILATLDPEIEWEMVGEMNLHGQDEVRKSFFEEDHEGMEMTEMHVENILSHGKFVTAWGTMQMSDGTGYRFCDILEFANASNDAKVKKVIGFLSKLTPDKASA